MVLSASLSDIIVPLVSRRRERLQVLQKVQQGIPSLVLFLQGLDRILTGAGDWNRWLGTLQTFAGMLVLGAISRAITRLRWGTHQPPRQRMNPTQVDWIVILLSLLLVAEVAAHYYETRQLRDLTLVLAIATLAGGLLHGRLKAFDAKREVLRVTDSGVSVGGRFFNRFTAAYEQISRIDIAEKSAIVVLRDGRTKEIDLIDIRHSNDVTRALTKARTRLEPAAEAAGVASGIQT